jgi:hypothetical protein
MSTATLCRECPGYPAAPSNVGFSDVSELYIRILKEQIGQMRNRTVTFERPLEKAQEALFEVFGECKVEDWDGYGASPVTPDALDEIWRLIQLLPSFLPIPEILAEPSGEIGLEWCKDQRSIFVVSVSGKHRINYAGLFGENKTHGSEYFGESLPSIIIENLRRLYYHR